MKNPNKLVGAVLIFMGLLSAILRSMLQGYHNVWDFVMLGVFILTVIIGISCFKRK